MSADVGPRTLLRVISELIVSQLRERCFLVTVTVRTLTILPLECFVIINVCPFSLELRCLSDYQASCFSRNFAAFLLEDFTSLPSLDP